jgi:hypothetical protein
MPIELVEDLAGHITVVHLLGKLEQSDYANLASEFGALVAKHGKLRVLLDMKDFHGWDSAALWAELKFDLKHFSDIERMAAVGDKAWEHGLIAFTQPFTKATIRYFDPSEESVARAWLTSPARAQA